MGLLYNYQYSFDVQLAGVFILFYFIFKKPCIPCPFLSLVLLSIPQNYLGGIIPGSSLQQVH